MSVVLCDRVDASHIITLIKHLDDRNIGRVKYKEFVSKPRNLDNPCGSTTEY